MTNKDIISRYILDDEVIVSVSETTKLVEYARLLHNTTPTSTAALGRTLTAATMMAANLKQDGHKLTISFNGGGPAGTVMATANSDFEVKGMIANPAVILPARADGKLDVGGAIGRNGFLTISRDMGRGEPYVGRTPIVSGEIAEDIAHYFLMSEQQPSIVYLSVWVDIDTTVIVAGGMIITPLPGASDAVLKRIEARIDRIQNYALMLMNQSPSEAAVNIFEGCSLKHLVDHFPKYFCDCSRDRLEQVIISLGKEEIEDILEKDGHAEIVCHFCNKKYGFNAKELKKLLIEAMH
jgi:molecular chaperone Hsp33